jgi:NADH-quinone oxidoreductase subunit H
MFEFLDFLHYDVITRIVPPVGSVPLQLVYAGAILASCVPIVGFISAIAMVWTLAERKISGYIQVRLGPNRVGWWGVLQPVADGIKCLAKEDIIPDKADRTLFRMAPLMVFAGALLPFAALPFSDKLVVASLAAGILYVLAFESIEVIGVIMAGWAPNSKWSLYGGMRLAAQMISYEIPLGLCALTVVVLTGTLNLGEIIEMQSGAGGVGNWLVWPWVSPFASLAFVIFYVAGLAGSKRAPFDLPEAESELVAGFHTEYSGMRFSFFFLAEYAAMYVVCAIAVICFLGGWHGPFLEALAWKDGDPTLQEAFAQALTAPAEGWFVWANLVGALSVLGTAVFWKMAVYHTLAVTYIVGKAWFLLFVMVWIRWTFPRIRIDQVIHICLKVLLPFSLLCVLGAAVQQVFFDANLLQWLLEWLGG